MQKLDVTKVWANGSGRGYQIELNDFFTIYVKHFYGYDFTEVTVFSPVRGGILEGYTAKNEEEDIYNKVLDGIRAVLRRYEKTYKKSKDNSVKIQCMLERQKLLNKLQKENVIL